MVTVRVTETAGMASASEGCGVRRGSGGGEWVCAVVVVVVMVYCLIQL